MMPQTSGQRFESGISHNDPGALQDHCVIPIVKNRVEWETFHLSPQTYLQVPVVSVFSSS